jgi:hypothetical protein
MRSCSSRGIFWFSFFLISLPSFARSNLDFITSKHLDFQDSSTIYNSPNPDDAQVKAELAKLSNMADLGIPVTPNQLSTLGPLITNGDCIAIDMRTGKLSTRRHILHIDHSDNAPGKTFVFGSVSTAPERPDGLTALSQDGTYSFGNESRQGSVLIESTFDDKHKPVLILRAQTDNGISQYCRYPLKQQLVGVNNAESSRTK